MGVKGLAPVKTEGLMGSAFVLFFFPAQRRLAFFFELGYTHVSSSSLHLSFQLS